MLSKVKLGAGKVSGFCLKYSGIAAVLVAILAYMGGIRATNTANDALAMQRIYEAWDLLGGSKGTVAVAVKGLSTDSASLELARREIMEALKYAPRSPAAHRMMSSYYTAKGDWKSSREWAIKAVKLDQDDPESYNSLGIAYLQLKQYGDAEKNFYLARKLAPEEPRFIKNLLLSRACQSNSAHSTDC